MHVERHSGSCIKVFMAYAVVRFSGPIRAAPFSGLRSFGLIGFASLGLLIRHLQYSLVVPGRIRFRWLQHPLTVAIHPAEYVLR